MVAVVDRALEVAAPAVLARPDRLLQGADRVVGVHAAAGGPADDPAGEQVHDEGGVAEPRPGRHVGEVDHPAPVWAGGGEVAAQRAERGPGSPWRARWCAPSCPARRRSDSGARMRRSRGAAGHPGALLPGVEQPPGLPGSQRRVERLGPPGRGSSRPGRRPRSTSWRAACCGRRSRWTGRSCTLTRSGRCRSARPRTPPSGPRCRRRSAGRAVELRRHGQADALRPIAPPAPGPRTSFSSSPVRRASSVVVPGRSPATDPNPLADPGRAGSRGRPPARRPRA